MQHGTGGGDPPSLLSDTYHLLRGQISCRLVQKLNPFADFFLSLGISGFPEEGWKYLCIFVFVLLYNRNLLNKLKFNLKTKNYENSLTEHQGFGAGAANCMVHNLFYIFSRVKYKLATKYISVTSYFRRILSF